MRVSQDDTIELVYFTVTVDVAELLLSYLWTAAVLCGQFRYVLVGLYHTVEHETVEGTYCLSFAQDGIAVDVQFVIVTKTCHLILIIA